MGKKCTGKPTSKLHGMLVYNGRLAVRDYTKKERSLASPIRKHLSELEDERRVIINDVISLGKPAVIEYQKDNGDYSIRYSIGVSVVKEPKSGHLFAVILTDDEILRYNNLNEWLEIKSKHIKPATWQGTRNTEVSIIPITPTARKKVLDTRECTSLPKTLKSACVSEILSNVNVFSKGLLEHVLPSDRYSRYSIMFLLFYYDRRMYMKSQLIKHYLLSGESFTEQAFITQLKHQGV